MVAMATALFLFIFLYMVWNGFSKGGTIFSLSDVNLIFPSPIGRTRALFYGLFRQIGTVLLVGIFSSTSTAGSTTCTTSPWGPWR